MRTTQDSRWCTITARQGRLALLMSLCCLGSGCKAFNRGQDRYELIEAELRTRERELVSARAELDRCRQLLQMHRPILGTHCADSPQLQSGVQRLIVPVLDVSLGSGTGGVDEDGQPGDEHLMVAVVPRDQDGTVVKVPAKMTVFASEINPQGLKSPLGKWEVSEEQLRRAWRSGFLSSGYFVPLQWERLPIEARLRIAIRFVTSDGRVYEADKDVPIQPMRVGISPRSSIQPEVVLPSTLPSHPPRAEELPPPAALLNPPKP